jgi:hypothetical protein
VHFFCLHNEIFSGHPSLGISTLLAAISVKMRTSFVSKITMNRARNDYRLAGRDVYRFTVIKEISMHLTGILDE